MATTLRRRIRVTGKKLMRLTQTAPKLKFYFGWHYLHSPIKPDRILFESFHGKNISDTPLAVLEELIESGEYKQYEIFFSTDDIARDRAFVKANNLPVKLVDVTSRRYTEILATAKYLLNNSSFPAYFIRKPGQTYIQTWHGTPLKALGKRMRLGMESMSNVQHNFLQADYLTFPNDFTREVIMRDYNLNDLYTGTVAMVGYPRNSVFMKGENKKIRRKYDLEGYECFAYMPTWRGTSNHAVAVDGYKKEVEEYLARIDESLRDNQKLFVNFHAMVSNSISLGEYKHVFPFPETVGNYDFLAQMDALITDYSSVFFDFALTGKPIILFAYDKEAYISDRGLYFPLEELPFPIIADIDELAECLRSGSFRLDNPGLDAFREKYLKYDSRDNSRRVLDLLLGNPTPDVPKISFANNKDKEWCVVDPQPRKSLADISTTFETADPEKEIVLLTRRDFGMQSSVLVHDEYRDDINYLFLTRTTPRTVAEEALSRVSSGMQSKLHKREMVRLLGDLNIVDERFDYCIVERGRSHSADVRVELESEFIVGEDYFALYFPAIPGTLEKVFVARGRRFDWVRDLTPEEIEGGFAIFEAVDLLRDMDLDLRRNGRYNLGVSYRDSETGLVRIGVGVQPGLRHKIVSADISKRYSRPVIVMPKDVDISDLRDDFRFDYSLLALAQDKGIALTPYYREDGSSGLLVGYRGEAMRRYCKPMALRIRINDGGSVRVTAQVKSGDFEITNAVLMNREESLDMNYEIPCRIFSFAGRDFISISFNPDELSLEGVYWDLALEIDEGFGYESQVYVIANSAFRNWTKLRNIQRSLSNGNILFPYSAKGRKVAFVHRPATASDTQLTKFKELAVFSLFMGLHPYWNRKRMWLIYEKYCSLAQDNGFHFFEYCMNEAGPEARKFVYFVIDKNSPDYANVAKYEPNVVDFMSFRHMLYCMVAKIYIASDSRTHLYQWRPKPSLIRDRIAKHKTFFLQHGVTALKRVDNLFGRRGSSPMTYFLTTSEREQDIVVEHFGYSPTHAPVLGFSRWDAFRNTANHEAPVILLMPTWRPWLEEQSDSFFVASEYFKVYSSLIASKKLQDVLEAHNARVKFFIHPKLSEYLRNFSADYSRIELIEAGSCPLSELIMECSMLVTDYSSVCWDVLYMSKPVVFYEFDQQRYKSEVGAYIDFNTELPGPVCMTEGECIEAIEAYIENGFERSEEEIEKAQKFLPVVDRNNRERTYSFLVDNGF